MPLQGAALGRTCPSLVCRPCRLSQVSPTCQLLRDAEGCPDRVYIPAPGVFHHRRHSHISPPSASTGHHNPCLPCLFALTDVKHGGPLTHSCYVSTTEGGLPHGPQCQGGRRNKDPRKQPQGGPDSTLHNNGGTAEPGRHSQQKPVRRKGSSHAGSRAPAYGRGSSTC